MILSVNQAIVINDSNLSITNTNDYARTGERTGGREGSLKATGIKYNPLLIILGMLSLNLFSVGRKSFPHQKHMHWPTPQRSRHYIRMCLDRGN